MTPRPARWPPCQWRPSRRLVIGALPAELPLAMVAAEMGVPRRTLAGWPVPYHHDRRGRRVVALAILRAWLGLDPTATDEDLDTMTTRHRDPSPTPTARKLESTTSPRRKAAIQRAEARRIERAAARAEAPQAPAAPAPGLGPEAEGGAQ